MKFKWFFCRDIWVSHCYILGQPGRSQIQCHLPCTKILTQSGTSTVPFFRRIAPKDGWALESNQYGKVAPFGDTEPEKGVGKRSTMVFWTCGRNLHHTRILLHRSFDLADEMAWLVALKMDLWGGAIFELGRVHFRPLFVLKTNRNRGRKWTLPSSKMVPPHGSIFRATSQAIFMCQFKRVMKRLPRCWPPRHMFQNWTASDATELAVWCDFCK